MKSLFAFGARCALIVLSGSLVFASEASDYRGFQFGMDVAAAAKQAAVDPATVKTVHQRPALIQELDWQPAMTNTSQTDPVKEGLLSFCNGELFRIVITYDRYKIEGMTAEDLIAGISMTYGHATRPAAKIAYHGLFSESANVLARWENERHVYNLADIGNGNFALILYSKSLDGPAQAAIAESIRLDALEAPQRELEKQRQHQMDAQLDLEKKRSTSRANFRP